MNKTANFSPGTAEERLDIQRFKRHAIHQTLTKLFFEHGYHRVCRYCCTGAVTQPFLGLDGGTVLPQKILEICYQCFVELVLTVIIMRRSSCPAESVLTTQPRVPPRCSGTVSTIPLSVHHSRDSSCYSSVIMAHCISCATRLRARRRRHSHREGSRAHLFFGAAFFLAAVCFFGAAFFLAASRFFGAAFYLASAFFRAAFFAVRQRPPHPEPRSKATS